MVTRKEWDNFVNVEGNLSLLKELGINSYEDLKKPIWKQFEEKDIVGRINFVDLKNLHSLERLYQLQYICEEPDNYKLLSKESKEILDKFMNGEFFEVENNDIWENLYRSFRNSDEWKKFRSNFFLKNTKCISCGKIANTVHHKKHAILTALKYGFLKPLENEEDFEPYCQECHCEIHGITLDKK